VSRSRDRAKQSLRGILRRIVPASRFNLLLEAAMPQTNVDFEIRDSVIVELDNKARGSADGRHHAPNRWVRRSDFDRRFGKTETRRQGIVLIRSRGLAHRPAPEDD
jgi:hypothetical protein